MWELGLEIARVAVGTACGVTTVAIVVQTYRVARDPDTYERNRQRYLKRRRLVKVLEL
ncbi:MAG: O6-methylguanine-DNA--protein-cysteine methyltransferase [Patiriisocius sp.]|jgi:O6-methylguanine-DNA--protein-cysteine methyltransferase